MSILKPKEETVDISVNEIKALIAFDIGVKPESIDLKVKVELSAGVNYFNNSNIEQATALLATVVLPGKTQKFEIVEADLKQVLEKNLQQSFENNNLVFNYKNDPNSYEYELLSVSVSKKTELTNDDLLMSSLSNMHNIVDSIEIKPKSLDDMSRTIDSLEASLNQARDMMRKNKF